MHLDIEKLRNLGKLAAGQTAYLPGGELLALIERLEKAEYAARMDREAFMTLCEAMKRLEEIVGLDTGGSYGPAPALNAVERLVKERDELHGALERIDASLGSTLWQHFDDEYQDYVTALIRKEPTNE